MKGGDAGVRWRHPTPYPNAICTVCSQMTGPEATVAVARFLLVRDLGPSDFDAERNEKTRDTSSIKRWKLRRINIIATLDYFHLAPVFSIRSCFVDGHRWPLHQRSQMALTSLLK